MANNTTVPISLTEDPKLDISTEVKAQFLAYMNASISNNSVFTRMKDKIKLITIDNTSVTYGALSISERAKLIVSLASNIIAPLTTQAMKAALNTAQFGIKEKYRQCLIKAEIYTLDANASKTEKEKEKLEVEKIQVTNHALLQQAKLRLDYGVYWPTSTITATTNLTLTNYGTKYAAMQLNQAQYSAILMKSYREHGNITGITPMSVSSNNINGEANIKPDILQATIRPYSSLSTKADWYHEGYIANQIRTQYKQFEAFDANKLEHISNASGNVMGVLLSSDVLPDNNDPTSPWAQVSGIWKEATTSLGAAAPTP